ncbi:hypothetical protein [Singulisphaera acidiphila]|uniref:Uncharacterized protein n=1 Tax=Singulisphaera acidiphila (strain ATCC BAA-1392 / DSM 18658 / VKM B-2454 / MOB10) TaxID=886293 RepID=L0D6X3_SINAD|nr:hypothetical protein [Singulisphaera acidiphila]AGA24625.1 hypothetical protein Sinac_0171 [Singulisphaera acidiphila DSM 18658]
MGPALWVTVASQKGHFPLQVIVPPVPPKGADARGGQYAGSLWLPENVWKGFRLRLMPFVRDVSGIPTEGKKLLVVANVGNVLHFRGFGDDGKVVVKTDETSLKAHAESIADLKKQLESLWFAPQLTEGQSVKIFGAVTSIAAHTRWPRDSSVMNIRWPRSWFTFQRLSLTSGVSWVLPLLFGIAAILTCWLCLAKNERIRRDYLDFRSCYPLPCPGADRQTPMADLLACSAQQAEELTALADPKTALMYRHPGLVVLAFGTFLFMGFYTEFSAHNLSNNNWLLNVFVMMLMLTYASSEVFQRWKIHPVTTDSPPIWPFFFIALLGSAFVWCCFQLAYLDLASDDSNEFEAVQLVVAALGCLVLLVVAWRAITRVEGSAAGAAQVSTSSDGCREAKTVPPSVIFGVILGGTLLGYLTFSMVTMEPTPFVSLLLMLVLAFLYGAVIHEALYLREYWTCLNALTVSVLSLPLGTALDRLPRRLTSRLGSFSEAWEGHADRELTERFRHVRETLGLILAEDALSTAPPTELLVRREDLKEVKNALDSAKLSNAGTTAQVSRALTRLLAPVWSLRGPLEGFADQGSQRSESSGSSTGPEGDAESRVVLSARSVEVGEMYLSLEVIRYLNRHLDILWIRVSALTVLTILLMATVNCYPYQPAGTLFQWTLLVVVLALVMIVRVLVGFNCNELISRVNKIPVDRSLWNLDFLGKLVAYVGPVLALLAALSVGMSDLIRLVLGPLSP